MGCSEKMKIMQMVREMERTAPKGDLSETLEGGRTDAVRSKREEIEGLMQATGLSDARIKEHLDKLEN